MASPSSGTGGSAGALGRTGTSGLGVLDGTVLRGGTGAGAGAAGACGTALPVSAAAPARHTAATIRYKIVRATSSLNQPVGSTVVKFAQAMPSMRAAFFSRSKI